MTAYDFWKLAAELVGNVSWPVAVIIVALLFRREIGSIIPELEQFGPSGIKLRERSPEQRTQPPVQGNSAGTFSLKRPVQQESLQWLVNQMEQRPVEQRENWLRDYAALTRLALDFENIYGQIYGSQLRGLIELDASDSVSIVDAQNFFRSEAAERYPEFYANTTFDKWLWFLLARKLITQDGDRLSLSPYGKEFLYYLRTSEYPLTKRNS